MTNPTPDTALLWARKTAAPHHGHNRTMDRAEAFRAGQSHDAGLLAALEGLDAALVALADACSGVEIPLVAALHVVEARQKARAAIAAAKGT